MSSRNSANLCMSSRSSKHAKYVQDPQRNTRMRVESMTEKITMVRLRDTGVMFTAMLSRSDASSSECCLDDSQPETW